MTVGLSIVSSDERPSADVLVIDSDNIYKGQQFIVVRLGDSASIGLPGFGREAADYARALAAALVAAADACMVPDQLPVTPPDLEPAL